MLLIAGEKKRLGGKMERSRDRERVHLAQSQFRLVVHNFSLRTKEDLLTNAHRRNRHHSAKNERVPQGDHNSAPQAKEKK